jgi:hypothetical protein
MATPIIRYGQMILPAFVAIAFILDKRLLSASYLRG